jgi:FAD/FMN-containing dehydrogenase
MSEVENSPTQCAGPKCLKQAKPDFDPLLDKFRCDTTVAVLRRFEQHGVTLEQLLELQKEMPIVYPWDHCYDTLRMDVNRRFVLFPMAIALPETEEQVVRIFKWARCHKIHVTPRSGSHDFEGFSLSSFIIIDQSRRTKVRIEESTVILEAGTLIGPLQLELSKHNLAMVAGTCPNNGMGLILGGGIGFLERKYGAASDNLLSAKVLIADGSLVTANKKENSDLFFAIRGAGHQSFGIITEFTIQARPISKVVVFDLIYEFHQLEEVLNTWQDWAPFTVDNLTSELDIYSDRVLVTGLFLGNKEELNRILARTFGHIRPLPKSLIKTVSFIDSVRHFGGREPWFPFFENKSGFAKRKFPPKAIEIIKRFMPRAGPQDHVELDAFGGAISEVLPTATAFVHRKVLFWTHLQAHWKLQEESPERIAWIQGFYDELKEFLRGAYANAPDRDLPHALEKYYGENLPRLREIKTKYDPRNIFHYQQSIPPLDHSLPDPCPIINE